MIRSSSSPPEPQYNLAEKLMTWLSQLSNENKFNALFINDQESFSVLLTLFNFPGDFSNQNLFCLDLKRKQGHQISFLSNSRNPGLKQLKFQQQILAQNIRIVTTGIHRGVALSVQLLSDKQTLQRVVLRLTSNLIFSRVYQEDYKNNSASIVTSTMLKSCWFSPRSFNTRWSWYLFFLEQNLLHYYFNQESSKPDFYKQINDFTKYLICYPNLKNRYSKPLFDIHIPQRKIADLLFQNFQKTKKKDLIKRTLFITIKKHHRKESQLEYSQIKILGQVSKILMQDYQQHISQLSKQPQPSKQQKPRKSKKQKKKEKEKRKSNEAYKGLSQRDSLSQIEPIPEAQEQCQQVEQDSTALNSLFRQSISDQASIHKSLQTNSYKNLRLKSNHPRQKLRISCTKSASKSLKPKANKKQSKVKLLQKLCSQQAQLHLQHKLSEQVQKIVARSRQADFIKQKVVSFFRMILTSELTESVELFGSQALGLNLQTSDLDFVVFLYSTSPTFYLKQLHSSLKLYSHIKQINFIEKAKQPVIKCQVLAQGQVVSVDISAQLVQNKLSYSGFQASFYVCQALKRHQGLSTSLLFYKNLFKKKKLLSLYEGGLSSLLLSLLLIAFYNKFEGKSSYRSLIKFLGQQFNPEEQVVDPSLALCKQQFERKQKREESLKIIVPWSREHLGSGVYRIRQVLQTFRQQNSQLKQLQIRVEQKLKERSKVELLALLKRHQRLQIGPSASLICFDS